MKNLDKIRNNIPEEQEKNKSDLITEQLKDAGMSEEEVDDLNKVAKEMEEFLSLIPDLHKQLELSSEEEDVLLYNIKVRGVIFFIIICNSFNIFSCIYLVCPTAWVP